MDDLAAYGSPLTNEELVTKVLSGLGAEYKEIFADIRARDNPISFEELFDKLLAYEVFVQHSESKNEQPIITANLASSAPRSTNLKEETTLVLSEGEGIPILCLTTVIFLDK